MGVLSDGCVAPLDYVFNSLTDNILEATVPTRSECRQDGISDAADSVSLTTPVKDPIQRLKERATFNDAYKNAMEKTNDTAMQKLALDKELLGIKHKEVEARAKEVQDTHLHTMYADLREDLKLAVELDNKDDIKTIKAEMQELQRRRLSLFKETSGKNIG